MQEQISAFARLVEVIESIDIEASAAVVDEAEIAKMEGIQEAVDGTQLFISDEPMTTQRTFSELPFCLPPFEKTTLLFPIRSDDGSDVPFAIILLTQPQDEEDKDDILVPPSDLPVVYGFIAKGSYDTGRLEYDLPQCIVKISAIHTSAENALNVANLDEYRDMAKAMSTAFGIDCPEITENDVARLNRIGEFGVTAFYLFFDRDGKLSTEMQIESIPLFLCINEMLERCSPQRQNSNYNVVKDAVPLIRCSKKEKRWRMRYRVLPITDKTYKKTDMVKSFSERNSPAMHERRGHYRHLQSGKIVWIKSCTVGKIQDGIVVKSYGVS
jgi:hypothetical protein